MNDQAPSRTFSQMTLIVVAVALLSIYSLLLKAYEVDNWPGFWFSAAHVLIVAVGTWLALRRA